jgi:6-phosphogluconolactonase
MNIRIASSRPDFEAIAEAKIADAIKAAIASKGSAAVGLSGGSTPGPIYAALGKRTDIDWSKITLVLIDERYVPADHPDSNFCMIERTLLGAGSNARAARFVAPDTKLPLDTCVPAFSKQLEGMTFDVVILGMGDDGHIASLFPPIPKDAFGPANAIHTTTDRFAVTDRISVTLPMLQKAMVKILLVTGKAKMEVLQKVEAGQGKDLPIANVAEGLEVIYS